MNHKTDWEVVDHGPRGRRPSPQDLMRAILGPHWRWKIAGMTIVAGAILTVAVLVAGVFFVGAAVVILAMVIALQFRHWLSRAREAYRMRTDSRAPSPAPYRDTARRNESGRE